jgi:hypothetical protein
MASGSHKIVDVEEFSPDEEFGDAIARHGGDHSAFADSHEAVAMLLLPTDLREEVLEFQVWPQLRNHSETSYDLIIGEGVVNFHGIAILDG